jgi:hypothetical protein
VSFFFFCDDLSTVKIQSFCIKVCFEFNLLLSGT